MDLTSENSVAVVLFALAGWSGSVHYADTIMLVFSWNGSYMNRGSIRTVHMKPSIVWVFVVCQTKQKGYKSRCLVITHLKGDWHVTPSYRRVHADLDLHFSQNHFGQMGSFILSFIMFLLYVCIDVFKGVSCTVVHCLCGWF